MATSPEEDFDEDMLEDESLPDDFDLEEQEDGSAKLIPASSEDREDDEDDEDYSDFYDNLAATLDAQFLSGLAVDYLRLIDQDKEARSKRDAQYADALKRTGLGEEAPGGADFAGASKVTHPLIAESAIEFTSSASKELFPANGPVRTNIIGRTTPKKMQKAARKARHMNWQCRTQIKEFKPSVEQILTQTAISGVQYAKMYYWHRARRPKIEFVPMDFVYVPATAPSFYAATRKTHHQRLEKIEFEERVSSGLYVADATNTDEYSFKADISESEKANDSIEGVDDPVIAYDDEGLRDVYEVYCWLEIEDDKETPEDYKYAPYIMTIDEPTQRVIGLYRNWDPEDKSFEALDWMVEFSFIPWRGAYAIGLCHLIEGLSAATTGALRALLDSAHINNSPTGIKLKGAQVNGQSVQPSIGQIAEIESAPGIDDIRKIAMPLPFNPPSTVLFQLLGFLLQEAKGVVRTAIEQNPEFSPNTPPGTEYSRIEQGLKVYSSIHSRMHDSMERLLGILHRLNKDYLEDNGSPNDSEDMDSWDDESSEPLAYKSDYEGEMDVQPVSDPNIFSEAQRFAQMQSVGQLVEKAPDLYDRRAYHKRMLELMKVPNVEEILPEPPGLQDENPVTENIKMATGQMAAVLPDQEHLAHIQVHMDFWLSPTYGQNPALKPALAKAWLEHMMQHTLMLYGSEMKNIVEQASGMNIKDIIDDAPEVLEALSKAAAAASPIGIQRTTQMLSEVMKALAEAQQYVQQLQPPMPMDPSQAALQAKQVDAQIAEKKSQTDLQLAQQKSQVEIKKSTDKLQVEQLKSEDDKEIAKLQSETDMAEATLEAQVEIKKNTDDNNTALMIAGMRAAEKGSSGIGNLKNGNSIDQNFP